MGNYHTLEDSLEPEVKDETEEVEEESIEAKVPAASVEAKESRARSKSPKEHKPRPLRRSLSMQHRASKANGSSATSSSSIGRPPSSNGAGPSSIISALGSGSKKRLPENPAAASSYATGSGGTGDGWQTVGAVHPNKFQMKKSTQKKWLSSNMWAGRTLHQVFGWVLSCGIPKENMTELWQVEDISVPSSNMEL